ncbi:hypothetical protein [Cupriavidus metallidurans]|nr:hypothetical protein [Cupriavidus metallidurans]QGS30199.1 hypothetical protein FOB83_15620 [Cupriavidus metallidurans]
MPDAAAGAFAHVTADLSGEDMKLSRRKPKSDALPGKVLAVLAQAPAPLSAGRVAKALAGVSRPTVTETLRAMAEAGAVLTGRTEGGQTRYAAPTSDPAQGDDTLRAGALRPGGW